MGLVAVLAAAVSALAEPAAKADPKDDKTQIDKQIDALRNELDDTSAQLANAYLLLRRTQAELPGAQATLDRAVTAQARAEQRNDEMAAALEVAGAREQVAISQSARSQSDIADARRRVAQFASQLYQDQGMGQLAVALNATSPDDFASRVAMTETVGDVQRRSLARLSTLRAGAAANEAHLVALRQEVTLAKKEAERAVVAASAARKSAQVAKTRLDDLARAQVRQAAAVEAQKGAEERRLKGLQEESQRLQRVLAARARAAKIAAARAKAQREAAARAAAARAKKHYVPPAPETSGGFLSAPSGGRISSEFGMRFHPILRYWRLHAGRDYAAACGEPVTAAAPGTVISAGWAGDYGNRVVIDHGVRGGVSLVTTYNHMNRIARTSGTVSRGEVIGYIGTTGASTGCHLHFEVREDGTPVDPRKWL
ncbi:M23 family metallopeptidase [Knoellia koreensis]|uniref:Peptidoglycan DD-metalloendopeptidase family protein n=1 Tax=Knoellia koreensis TaxID=2730921 RepID=A0A849HKB5_9MICO|nr:M23 family metallopeptidase [Knoellia sp. DB2414S]NNM47858.1 peptidoglycan DD-metalloendopeptidase family protein [Knoellia sp. DB2414S]